MLYVGDDGLSKGVLYSHRSQILHAFAVALPDVAGLSEADSVLPAAPMFHVNAWGIPYAAALTGARLVLPGPRLHGAALAELIEGDGVTIALKDGQSPAPDIRSRGGSVIGTERT